MTTNSRLYVWFWACNYLTYAMKFPDSLFLVWLTTQSINGEKVLINVNNIKVMKHFIKEFVTPQTETEMLRGSNTSTLYLGPSQITCRIDSWGCYIITKILVVGIMIHDGALNHIRVQIHSLHVFHCENTCCAMNIHLVFKQNSPWACCFVSL